MHALRQIVDCLAERRGIRQIIVKWESHSFPSTDESATAAPELIDPREEGFGPVPASLLLIG